MSIGDHLYTEAQKLQRKKADQQAAEMKKIKEQQAKASDKSSQIVEKLTASKIQEIFELLDVNRDGLVSVDDIGLENLSTEVLEAFGPLFIELEDLQATLDRSQFQDAALRLLKVFDLPLQLVSYTT